MRTIGCSILGIVTSLILLNTFWFWCWFLFGLSADLVAWTKPAQS